MNEFETPNLDACASADDMQALAQVFATLADYAGCKALAMRAREAGRIDEALHTERTCDSIYSKLPQWARW